MSIHALSPSKLKFNTIVESYYKSRVPASRDHRKVLAMFIIVYPQQRYTVSNPMPLIVVIPYTKFYTSIVSTIYDLFFMATSSMIFGQPSDE